MLTSDEKTPNSSYLTATYVAADYIELLPFCCALQQLLKMRQFSRQHLQPLNNVMSSSTVKAA
ncbi:hypothetical protein T03_2260 [Trichinella britovi]|uniref:Uncharacterized protein n=1 Tax=Trichinella britovi TaxID=45882 RepID=A0A0V1DB20_TRIBR|nr:hypothetical protein T03_2260 [Trichinella britovi]